MNNLESFKLLSISLLLAAGLAACDSSGPAETAGKKLDDATNRAGEKIENAGEQVQDAAKGDKP